MLNQKKKNIKAQATHVFLEEISYCNNYNYQTKKSGQTVLTDYYYVLGFSVLR